MMTAGPRIALESPDQPDVIALIDALDAYQKPLYPPESHYGVDLATLKQPNVLFAVARDTTGRALGCAGLMLLADYAEVKRMYVDPACRGQGIARALLDMLEGLACEHGLRLLRLETGKRQPEALHVYERQGFRRRGPFGDYPDDPTSVFMEKALA